MEHEVVRKLQHTASVDELIRELDKCNKAGEVRSIMTVYFDKEGNISTHWSGIPSVTRAVGALERLKIALCASAGDT